MKILSTLDFDQSLSLLDLHGHFSVFNILLGLSFLKLFRQIRDGLLSSNLLLVLRLDQVKVAARLGNDEIVDVL